MGSDVFFLHWRWGPTAGTPPRLPRRGPRPQRELTLMPQRGVAWPRFGIAAGAHAASANEREDVVGAEASAGGQAHSVRVDGLYARGVCRLTLAQAREI